MSSADTSPVAGLARGGSPSIARSLARSRAKVNDLQPDGGLGILSFLRADPLPSWNDGKAKQSIEAFVQRVATVGGKDFVPPAERIAVFDNDGTLWPEYPLVGQLAFILDELKRRIAIYMGPKAPKGFEKNWIPTVPGRGWFTLFRFYAPTEAYFDKSWALPSIEKVK